MKYHNYTLKIVSWYYWQRENNSSGGALSWVSTAFPAVTLTLSNKKQLSHQTDNYLTSLYSRGSKETSFRRCNNGQPLTRLVEQRRGSFLYRKKGIWAGLFKGKVHWRKLGFWNMVGFHWLSWDSLWLAKLLPGKEKIFIPLDGSSKVVSFLARDARDVCLFLLASILMSSGTCMMGFTGGASGKKKWKEKPACQCRRHKRCWVGKILWSSKWQPTPVFLPGESRGQRSLSGYSP